MGMDYEKLQEAFDAQTLFEDKTWRVSPEPFRLSSRQVAEIEKNWEGLSFVLHSS